MNREEQQTAIGILFMLLAVFYWRTGIYTWRIEDIVSLTVVIIAVSFFGLMFIKARFR